MWTASPQPGDWVRTTRTEHTGIIDSLTGPGLPVGTRAVVVDRFGSLATVRADAGWGTVSLTVPARHLRVIHRGRGEAAFTQRVSRWTAVRLGAFAALAAPIVWFVIAYVWANRTVDGLEVAFVVGMLDSAAMSLVELVNDPVRVIVVSAIGALAARIAFGPRRRSR